MRQPECHRHVYQTLRHEPDVPDPRVAAVGHDSAFYQDGVSLVVTSASDPTVVQDDVDAGVTTPC